MVRISNFQVMIMIFSTVLANGMMFLPRVAAGLGGPGGWLVVLLQGIVSLMAVMALAKVSSQFPNESFTNLNKKVFGRFIGTAVGLIIVIYLIFEVATVARGVVNVAIIAVYYQTPQVLLMGLLMAVAVYAIYQGIEVLVRVNTILFALKLIAIITIFLLSIPAFKIDNLEPLWDRGQLPWAQGIVNIHTAFSGFIILAFLYPNINKQKDTVKSASTAMVLITWSYVMITVLTIAAFNSCEVIRMLWPALDLVQNVPFPVDAPFMTAWVTNAFSVTAGFLYMASDALKDILNIKDYRSTLLPLAVITVAIGVWPKDMVEFGQFSTNIGYMGFALEMVLPFFLLAVITLRAKNKPKP